MVSFYQDINKSKQTKNKRKASESETSDIATSSTSPSKLNFGDLSLPEKKRVRFNDTIDSCTIAHDGSLIGNGLKKGDVKKSAKKTVLKARNRIFKSKASKKKEKEKIKLQEKIIKEIQSSGNSDSELDVSKLDSDNFHVVDFKIEIPNDIKLETKESREDDVKSDTRSFNTSSTVDSREQSRKCFQWLISPYDVDFFFANHWEKKPLLIKRQKPTYYNGIVSTADIDRILKERHVLFNKNIDVTIYKDDERETLVADGRAYGPVVWDKYQNGYSIRLLNPQTFFKSVWKMNSILQQFFGSQVGANVYLTPPGSQGFAPHYDDIEAFILQLEGRKTWTVYEPLDDKNTLPRESSGNFKRDQLTSRQVFQIELEAGDMLYFPRGFIHEGKTTPDIHSLHITISAAQKHTIGDLIENALPQIMVKSFQDDINFRKSLPVDSSHFLGSLHCDEQNEKREQFKKNVKQLMLKMIDRIDIDSAFDGMMKNFVHKSLPPFLTQNEKINSIHGSGESWCNETNTITDGLEIESDTPIRLIRYNSISLAKENEGDSEMIRLYHNFENSYDPYHDMEAQYVEIDKNFLPGLKSLISTYPDYMRVDDLPLLNLNDKLDLANLLYDKGIIMTEQSLETDD